ncbi:glycosyltransferase family 2 protein [uncultured Pseudoteredinibacter sp.]|uniref:glycosyltransferase family 2 protein n=1 Tax=uncultured Pseudoteredinibacter sp. TaxID=1641701 RepID=UPI002601D380|nr:glycosyltransferase family 2 protein [uncultured Pseudoteredinibacter sp.]
MNNDTASSAVAIFLSCYNGAEFLNAQLDSLLAQDHQNFCVYCRDDGSSDGTQDIIQEYISKYPTQFSWLQGEDRNLKPCGSFASLMQDFLNSDRTADYFMFCDQDDVWLPNKISLSIEAITAVAPELGDVPILVHSELKVVDESLGLISKSLSEYQGLLPGHNLFGRALINSSVTGCTMLFNRQLLDRSLPIPEEAVMHDWWLALIAQAFGKIVFIRQPTIQYRQHGANTLGAKQKTGLSSDLGIHKKLYLWLFSSHDLNYVCDQSRAFMGQHGKTLSLYQRWVLRFSLLLNMRAGLFQKLVYRIVRKL